MIVLKIKEKKKKKKGILKKRKRGKKKGNTLLTGRFFHFFFFFFLFGTPNHPNEKMKKLVIKRVTRKASSKAKRFAR